MSLEPSYRPQVVQILDEIEEDPDRRPLWNAICDAIDLVCDRPTSEDAKREAVRHVFDIDAVWQVPIRCYIEDENWVMLWYPDGKDAVILYIGPRPFR